jgi:hypothetical protein
LCLLFGRDRGATGEESHGFAASVHRAISRARLRRIGVCACVAMLMAAAACAPFVLRGQGRAVWRSYAGAVGLCPAVSANAFNLWTCLMPVPGPGPRWWKVDQLRVAGVRYYAIGMLLLVAATGVIGLRSLRRPEAIETWRWASVALCLVFFTFPTQIHERYLHPAIAVVAWAFVPRLWWLLIWLALAWIYAVNLVWATPLEAGWLTEGFILRVADWSAYGWPASKLWGLAMTLVTMVVLVMPVEAWRDKACVPQD